MADNEATRAFLKQLPLSVTMGELNGNEKYYYMPNNLPTGIQHPEDIQTGDLMLYSSDCLVLFYKNFSTSYNYTRLGILDDPSGLENALGHGSVSVTISIL